jgi:type II secretory pathway pseudopilin PulG
VEILIDIGIIALVGAAIVTAYFSAYKSIELAKTKSLAVMIANEKMEQIRNLPYNSLATAHGSIYPPGDIADSETVVREGINFQVTTQINYIDDVFDGNFAGTIVGKPTDTYPYDYKKVDITVGKAGRQSQLAKLSSNISAKAAETPTDTGILYLCVYDSVGAPVEGASVTITNDSKTPPVNMTVQTPQNGCAMIPALPPEEHNRYHIVVEKDGYSMDMTYPRTAQNPHAIEPDANILVQQVTYLTFAIDLVSTMRITFVDQAGARVPNVSFTLEGSKLIYNNPDTVKYSQDFTANAQGEIEISNLEFDSYKLKNFSGYTLVSTNPMQEIPLPAKTTLDVTAVLSTSASNPVIYNFSPTAGKVGQTVTVTVNGDNIANGTSIKLKNPTTGVEIVGTDISVNPQSRITADFNLTAAEVGLWDLIISNANGEAKQGGGFSISQ